MSEAKREDEWDRTSHVLAEVHNAFLSDPRYAITAAQRNPFTKRTEPEVSVRVGSTEFREAFKKVRKKAK